MEDTERARYIDGLRTLAAVLEANPDIPLPLAGRVSSRMTMMFLSDATAREQMAAAARAFPCTWTKRVSGKNEEFFDLRGTVGALNVALTALRDAVCERVVVGTTEVTEDEVVTEAVTRPVTKTVDVVEWRCSPLLAPRAAELPAG